MLEYHLSSCMPDTPLAVSFFHLYFNLPEFLEALAQAQGILKYSDRQKKGPTEQSEACHTFAIDVTIL